MSALMDQQSWLALRRSAVWTHLNCLERGLVEWAAILPPSLADLRAARLWLDGNPDSLGYRYLDALDRLIRREEIRQLEVAQDCY